MGRTKTIEDAALLEVARGVFREKGQTATTRDVARAAGISQGVLYQRFKTKEELFFAAMLPSPPDIGAFLGERKEKEKADVYLQGIASRLLTYFLETMPVVFHLFTHPAFQQERLAAAHEHLLAGELTEGLTACIQNLQEQKLVGNVDPRAASEAFIAAIHSVAVFRLLAGNLSGEKDSEQIQRFLQVFWHGLMPH